MVDIIWNIYKMVVNYFEIKSYFAFKCNVKNVNISKWNLRDIYIYIYIYISLRFRDNSQRYSWSVLLHMSYHYMNVLFHTSAILHAWILNTVEGVVIKFERLLEVMGKSSFHQVYSIYSLFISLDPRNKM